MPSPGFLTLTNTPRSLDLVFIGLVLRGDLSLIPPVLVAIAAYANAHGDLTDEARQYERGGQSQSHLLGLPTRHQQSGNAASGTRVVGGVQGPGRLGTAGTVYEDDMSEGEAEEDAGRGTGEGAGAGAGAGGGGGEEPSAGRPGGGGGGGGGQAEEEEEEESSDSGSDWDAESDDGGGGGGGGVRLVKRRRGCRVLPPPYLEQPVPRHVLQYSDLKVRRIGLDGLHAPKYLLLRRRG